MRNKKDLMVVMAACYRTKQPWGITLEKKGNYCEFQWAFKISKEYYFSKYGWCTQCA